VDGLDKSVEVDEISLEGIVRFLWRVRKIVMITIIVSLLLLWGYILLDEYRTSLDRYRTAFAELQTYYYVEDSDFSSANLNRIDQGVYRLRVEVSGDHTDERREDTPVDFDRDLRIIIHMRNGFLSLNVTNLRDDIIVQDVEIRGNLLNRAPYEFNQISIVDVQTNLGHNESSRGIPISVFTVDDYSQLQLENWRWLTDVEEFRENFKLHHIEVSFTAVDEEDELIRLRYTTSTDFYEIRNLED